MKPPLAVVLNGVQLDPPGEISTKTQEEELVIRVCYVRARYILKLIFFCSLEKKFGSNNRL